MEKKDLGKLFVQKITLDRNAPRRSAAPMYELTYPYRISDAIVLRIFGRHGISVGWWQDNPEDPDDEEAMSRYLLKVLGRIEGPPEFQEAMREAHAIQEARRALADDLGLYEPNHGFMTGENDGPQEDLGQVAEVIATKPVEDLTDAERAECER